LIDIEKLKVVGYFSLSISVLLTNNLSKNQIKKIDGISKNKNCLYFYLIGQLGVSDFYIDMKVGSLLLSYAINEIKKAQKVVGGRYILVDAINHLKVINFYQNNGFKILFEDRETIKMVYKL